MIEQQERKVARSYLTYLFNKGFSIEDFYFSYDYEPYLMTKEVHDAITGLKDRRELEHMIKIIWTFKR